MHRQLATLTLMIGVLAIAGCGGSSTSNVASSGRANPPSTPSGANEASNTGQSGSSKTLSRAALIASADVVCRRLNQRLAAAKDSVRTAADYGRIARRRSVEEAASLSELSKLTAPPSMSREWQEILNARKTIVSALEEIGQDAGSNGAKPTQYAFGSSAVAAQLLRRTAKQAGLRDCGQVG